MQVHWLEQCLEDVRRESDWLSHDELERLSAMRVPKRRDDWRLGRWTAKQAVARFLAISRDPSNLTAIEIRPADSGAPEVYLRGSAAPVSISISHRDGRAACAIAAAGSILGCDLEVVEPRCDAFITDYFTADEQGLVAGLLQGEKFRLLGLLWSAKESTLKALREGLRLDPRGIEVGLGENFAEPGVWHPLVTRSARGTFQGWYQWDCDVVRTLVCEPACSSPPIIRPD